jgi:hypothetical protein
MSDACSRFSVSRRAVTHDLMFEKPVTRARSRGHGVQIPSAHTSSFSKMMTRLAGGRERRVSRHTDPQTHRNDQPAHRHPDPPRPRQPDREAAGDGS